MSPRIGLDLPTLLKAAGELADEKGLEEVTLASLAQKLNIRSPSLYNHVNGLPGLRLKLAVHAMDLLCERMKAAGEGLKGNEAAKALGFAYVAFARSHPGLYDAIIRVPRLDDPEVGAASERIVRLTVGVLGSFGLAGDAALHAVRGFRSILHGFASLEQSGGFGLPLDLDESLRLLLDAFLAGIESKGYTGIDN